MTGTDSDLVRSRTSRLCEQLADLREFAESEGAGGHFRQLVRTVQRGRPDEAAAALQEIDEQLRRWGDPLGLDGQVRGGYGSPDPTGLFEDHPVEEFYVCPRGRCRRRARRLLHTPAPHCQLHDAEYAVLRLDGDD